MDIIKEVEIYTTLYYEENFSSSFSYHSLEHTRLVASMASKIAETEELDTKDKEIVVVAAWFHDIGHTISIEHHEDESCRIARQFLLSKEMDEKFISEVESCIQSTKRFAPKKSKLDEILYDADHAHTGMLNFMEVSNLLRKEIRNHSEKKCSKLDYWEKTLKFLKETKFLTKYATENMEPLQNENIKKVEKRIKKLKANKLSFEKRQNDKSTARGIETMFRLTARNQINLSSIADNKANIMLTINAVIISVLVSTSAFSYSAGRGPNFLIPGLILVIGSLTSLVFAVLSVRPKVVKGPISDEDLKNRKVDLLFFGNFYRIDYPKYEKAVKEMMKDYNYLYGSMIKDQYNLGKVLSQKYTLLTYSYNFFMFSFIIAVVVFFVLYFSKL